MKNTQSKGRRVSVIIPAFNKESALFATIDQVIKQLKVAGCDFEIVIINDGSTDNTLEEAVRAKRFNGNSEKIKIYHYPKNQGKGFALTYGFAKTSGDLVAFCDADLDLPPVNLRVALAYLDQEKVDIVIGSKRHPLSQVNYPILRRFLSLGYQILIKFLFNLNVSDTQCGLKVFKREILETILPKLVVKAFAFDLELLVVAKQYGFSKITESPVQLDFKFNSTISPKAIKNILQDTAAIFYRKSILNYYAEPKGLVLRPLILGRSA